MASSSHVLGAASLHWSRLCFCRRKDCAFLVGTWLLLWLSLFARPARSSPQGLGPRLLDPLPAELRFSNTTGASLNCGALGQPAPRISWLREGAELVPLEGLLTVLPNGTLHFPPFPASQFRQDVHGTTYRCRAANLFGAVLSTEVRVRAVVEQYYEVQVYDEFTIAGNTAVLRCHVPSFVRDDVVVVSWEQKQAEKTTVVTNGARMSVFPSGELQVRRVQQSDAVSDFRCRTWHRLTGETKLSSYGRLVVTDLKVNVPPRITNVRSAVVAHEGDSVELPCAAQGYPPPKYLWERLSSSGNGSPPTVVGSSRHEPSEGSLLIRKVEAQDAGKYLCLVNNAVGEERATITLDVRSPVEARIAPEVLTAHVGQSASLRCLAAGRPAPQVRWYKDALEVLEDGSRVRLLDDRRLLELSSVGAQDGGMYQCLASNALSQAQASAQVILGDTAPVLLEALRDSKLKPGDSLHMKCEATGSPAPKITWTVDDIPARHVKSSRVEISEASRGENHLVSYVNISHIRTDEAGVWQCVAVNSAGAAESSARVSLRGPPAVRPFGANRTAVATEPLALHCRLLSYPLRSVHWEKDGRKLPFHHRQRVFANGTLLVQATTVQDAGLYTCVATNEEGQVASASLHVAVKVPPLIERFAFDENLHEGMRTRVYCNIARGDPPVSIAWLRDGRPLKSGPDIEVRVLDAFSVALAIESLSPRHDGRYTCLASNAAATVNYTAPLRVHVPPHWIKEPVDTSAVEGHSASMDCVADGHPTPRVTWQRGIEPTATEYRQILSGPDYQVFENGTLRVAQVQVSDRGSYLCQASNGVGTGLSTVITLNVHVPARFSESYRNQTVQRGQNVGLECRALGDAPISISWSRNGRRLDTHKLRGSRVKNKQLPDGIVSTLSVPDAQREHSGIFICEVTNDYGQDETQIRLIVQEPPESPPGFNVTSVNSRSVGLAWNEPYSGNSPILSYLIQYKNASASWSASGGEDSSVRNVSAGRDQSSWTLRGLQPAASYHLRAAAVNALGPGPFTQPPLLVVTDEEVPGSPPTHVSVQTLGPQSLKVTWKPPIAELRHGRIKGYYVGYKLYNSSDLHLYKTVESKGDGDEDDSEAPGECVLNNLRKFTKYSVLVQAYNAIGAGPRSDEAVIYTAEDTPQVAPSGVHCSANSATSLRVSWAALHERNMDGVHMGYRLVYRTTDHVFHGSEDEATSSGPAWREHDVGPDSTATVVGNLEPFRNYSVRVAARTGAGAGAYSDPVHCGTPEAVPEAPEDIKALVLAPDAILVSWLPPVKVRGVLQRYTVYSRLHAYAENQPSGVGMPARPVAVPSSQFWHETRGLRTGQRYEFWVTASTGAGEGPATRIVTQSPEIRAPARIASFSRDVTVALKHDLELPCRTAGQPMPVREWRTSSGGPLRESERLRVLPSGTLRIETAEPEDAANYSCHAHNLYGRDAVHYVVQVHLNVSRKSPQRPASVSVLSTTSSSITLGWLKRNAPRGVTSPKVKEYELHYKRQQGSWDLVRVSSPPGPEAAGPRGPPSGHAASAATWANGTWLSHELTGLFCGTQYHIYIVAVADRGRSEPSDTVFARTQGKVPASPKRESFVSPNASSLTLRPASWSPGPASCPVSHLAVEYRARESAGPWLVASRALQPREGPMTLHHLRPDTWYSLRVTAHTDAGPAVAEYSVRTLPASATLAGTVLPELMVVHAGADADGELPLLVPIATSLSLALAAAALVLGYICCRRRTDPSFPKDHEGHAVSGRCSSNDALAESALGKRSSLDNVLSTLTSASGRQGSSYLTSPARHSVVAPATTPTQGSIDDISGYASFPETQIKSSNSRVVLKKTQETPVANTRIKRPVSIQKLASSDDVQRREKGADGHTPAAQFNHYDNPKAVKGGCPKNWQHTSEKGGRPYVIPQENKSTLEMEPEGEHSPRWSRSRRSNSNFINSGSTMIEKTYFFNGDELHSEDVEAFCVALSPRMEYATEEIKFS